MIKHKFTPDLSKRVNKIIGVFLGNNCYRTTNAKPSGYNYYVEPHMIENEMNRLFTEIAKHMATKIYQWYEIAAKFLENFLKISPFPNGNGRTARLLFSVLLNQHSTIPFMLV